MFLISSIMHLLVCLLKDSYSQSFPFKFSLDLLMVLQALGYVHGAQVVHASEPVHGRLRCG